MIGKVSLVGGNKCPICGKVFEATPPLIPNVEDREFYGGRIKFFKDVECDCTAKYKLCIEQKFGVDRQELNVINMIVLKVGIPIEEARRRQMAKVQEEAEAKAIEAVHQAVVEEGEVPTLKQRQEIKRQVVLATIVDKDEKIKTLTFHTIKELRAMCRHRKLKFAVTENKVKLAEKLLAYDPSLVVANPEGSEQHT